MDVRNAPTTFVSLTGILSDLRNFGDPEYQQRIWIEHRGPERDSFNESLNLFFADADVEKFIESRPLPEVTPEAYEMLAAFAARLDRFQSSPDGHIDIKDMLQLPEWKGIVAQAQEAVKVLEKMPVPKSDADRNAD